MLLSAGGKCNAKAMYKAALKYMNLETDTGKKQTHEKRAETVKSKCLLLFGLLDRLIYIYASS